MPSVREPVCADDRWYPRDAAHLRQWLDRFLSNVPSRPIEGELVALVAPHAGYMYSGQTAAFAYKQLEDASFQRAVVIGPSHFADLGAQAVNSHSAYSTPLGEVQVDADAVEALKLKVSLNVVSDEHEHSLEMQLPFLQYQLGNFGLVPLMMSQPFYIAGIRARNACEYLSAALTPLLDDRTLLVASSDLSHLHDYDSVTYYDQGFQNLFEDYEIGGLIDYMVNDGEPRACGDMAIITVMMAAKLRGANKITVLARTNSGDVTGNRESGQYTVGYMAAAIYKAKDDTEN